MKNNHFIFIHFAEQLQDFLIFVPGSSMKNIPSSLIHLQQLGVTPVLLSGKVEEQLQDFLISVKGSMIKIFIPSLSIFNNSGLPQSFSLA